MSIAGARTVMASQIASTGITAYADVVANPVAPSAMVRPSRMDYASTTSGLNLLRFDVVVFATQAQTHWDVGQTALDGWLAPAGVASIRAAIESDPTLGGNVTSSTVTGWTDYGISTYNGIDYFTARLTVDAFMSSVTPQPAYVTGGGWTTIAVDNAAGTPVQMAGDTISLSFNVAAAAYDAAYLGEDWRVSYGGHVGNDDITHEVAYRNELTGTYATYMGRLGKVGTFTWGDGVRTTTVDTIVTRVSCSATLTGILTLVVTHRVAGAVQVT